MALVTATMQHRIAFVPLTEPPQQHEPDHLCLSPSRHDMTALQLGKVLVNCQLLLAAMRLCRKFPATRPRQWN